ncbi:reverse transcriptase domain-containing protein [Tanacetum coccineum]|uniref:Reverse transcriptase domain-containing protein n=1 Tax=Tanacetum coccineum TaxID=301880 RepID=A0ABQ5HIH2_9ASTR
MCTYLKNMEGWKPKNLKNNSFANIQELFDKAMKRVNTFVDYRTELVEESSKKAEAEIAHESSLERAGEELEQESSKKQKLEEDKETTELKSNIYKEGKKSYFQIIRADGNSQMYLTFGKMLKNFDREDLEVLWSIVKARFKKTKPVNYMDNFLLLNLKTMFEHHVEDNVWKNQQGLVKVLNWKLYDSCGVHCVTMQSMLFYLLVEKMYPLTNHTLHQMFNDVKLQVDYECEMAFELLRLVKKQLKEGYGRIVGIKSLLEVTAAKLKEFDLLKWDPTRGILHPGTTFEEALNWEGSRAGRNAEGSRPSEIETRENGSRGMNLPLFLAAHFRRNESDQRSPPGTITKNKKAGTGSPPTEDLIMDCFLACPKAQANGRKGKDATPGEAPILMISRKSHNPRKRLVEGDYSKIGEITFPPLLNMSSADPVIIKAYVSGRQVNRVYLDGGSSCEVIYEHCFLKLKPSIQSLRVDSKIPLVGFSGEQSWTLGEVPLEITIGEGPLTVTKTLNFAIVRSDSPHNLLLGRTAMKQMGIIVSTIHGAIKFHTLEESIPSFHNTTHVGGEAFNTEHRVNELKHLDPVKQKKKSLAPKRNQAIHIQVKELTHANILREVKYQTWVSNPVIVKKADRRWKLCVDFTDINKACPKEHHPLPVAEQKVEDLHRHRLKCATYQKLIDKVFNNQLGQNTEVNADDIVIKSDSKEEMLADIKETLERLRVINLKLNPKKCSFGVEEGIFSRHLITKQGIKANPSKVKAISDLQPPKTVSEIQNLSRKLVALNRFLLKGADKTLPFMRTLKSWTSGKMVQWTTEADEDFRRMKELLEALPTVAVPTKGETLIMYLAVSEESISAVLMVERGKRQVPVYFVSRTLQGAELEYPELEKLILALVHAARKLRRYFQAHPIQVLSDKPIKQILARLEKSGRIAKWAIELGEHEIEFRERNSVKGQILADFLAERPSMGNREVKDEEAKRKEPELENTWKLFTDGASSFDGFGAGLILVSPEGNEYTYALRFEFETTNNEAEYETLLVGPRSVVSKIIRLGYYCPSMHKDAKGLIQRCETCQIHSLIPRKPKQEMISIMSTWPFSQWGIDILGPLTMAPGGARFLVVAINYFTKWVEAKLLTSTTGKHMERFVWEHIECRFRVPQTIISDNEKQFAEGTFLNEKRRRKDLDILEERREIASIKEAHYKQKLEGYYNKCVRPTTFKPGTYVLRLNSASKAEFQEKIGPTWEGPYIVKKAYGDGAYKLETLSGSPIDRTWNGSNLRKFYV